MVGPPHMTVQVDGDGYTAWVVIDSIVDSTSSGGVRIAADICAEEVRDLAREMTFKYTLFDLPRGGAKAGVRMAADLQPASRLQALQDFGRKVAPLLQNGIFNPGMDMNCGPDELRAIYAGAGIALGPVTDTAWFTAVSAAQALTACAGDLGITDRPLRVVIEGFGSVGKHLAQRLPASRWSIVGIATVSGAVWNPEGWDAAMLAELRTRCGDACIDQLPGVRLPRDELLVQDADVLVPASRTRVVTPGIARQVQARAMVPVANVPYAGGAVEILHGKGVICLPGYLANVGGVLASSLFDQGMSRTGIERLFEGQYRSIVGALLRQARERAAPVTQLTEEIASRRLPERGRYRRRTLTAKIYQRWVARRLPRRLRGALARRRCMARLQALELEITGIGRPS
jgi:glutamate dehydrogenase (NAD(P)+)